MYTNKIKYIIYIYIHNYKIYTYLYLASFQGFLPAVEFQCSCMALHECWRVMCCPLSFRETRRNDFITNSITNYLAIYLHMCPNDDFWEFQKAMDIEGNHLLGKTCRMKDLYVHLRTTTWTLLTHVRLTITVIGLICSVYIKYQDNACKTMSPKSIHSMSLSQFWHGGHSLR